MKTVLQTIALLCAVIALGGAAVIALSKDMPDLAVPAGDWQPGSVLDGQVYYTTDIVTETGDVIYDEFHFRNGTFQSAMCQIYCDFGWSDYQTKVVDDVLYFQATTRCPDAPHTVVFYGKIADENLSFEGTWTTRRWYWTHQINVTGEGTTTPTANHLAES
jgi:hypothetical protein